MTPDEQRLLDAVEKIEKIYTILAGDEMLHQEGLIQRLIKVEAAVNRMDAEITKAKGWMGGMLFAGAVLGSAFTWLGKNLFKL